VDVFVVGPFSHNQHNKKLKNSNKKTYFGRIESNFDARASIPKASEDDFLTSPDEQKGRKERGSNSSTQTKEQRNC